MHTCIFILWRFYVNWTGRIECCGGRAFSTEGLDRIIWLLSPSAVSAHTLGPPVSPHNSDRDTLAAAALPLPRCIAAKELQTCRFWLPSSLQRHKPGVLLQIPEEMSKREERCSQEVLVMFDKQIVFHVCTAVRSHTHNASPSPAASAVTHSSLWSRYHD